MLDPLPIEPLDGDDLCEFVDVDFVFARVKRPRGCKHLGSTEVESAKEFVDHLDRYGDDDEGGGDDGGGDDGDDDGGDDDGGGDNNGDS